MTDQTLDVLLRTASAVTDKVLSFREEHVLGVPAHAVVRAALQQPVALETLVGSPAELRVSSLGEAPRAFWGVVESVEMEAAPLEAGRDRPAPIYSFRLVSFLALLERSVDSIIFQDKDVQEIVTDVLERHGIDSNHFEWRLTQSYPKREYCVQYQESALNFVSRLLEAEGIHFYSELDPDAQGEKLVFCDDSSAAAPMPGSEVLPLREASALHAEGTAVYALSHAERLRSGKVTLRAFDFKRPDLDLTSDASADVFSDVELYDFSDDYIEPSDGQRLAQTRLEAEQHRRRRFFVETDGQQVHVGHKLGIDTGDGQLDLFVIAAVHEFENDRLIRESGGSVSDDGHDSYVVRAELIPIDVKFRPERVHPAPVLHGPQTATVVAPQGAQSEEIHTDEHGRAKVLFHWDSSGVDDDKASCWMRVTQLQTSGSMILPRVGWEAVVEFLDGNPDKPFVTGRLYNGVFMPPYQLPEGKTRSAIQTQSSPGGGGTNEIRYEDKAGSEEIMINSQYNTVIAVANNRDKTVGKNETLTIGNNATLEVGGNQDTKVTNGFQNTVKGDQSVSVGGNRTVEVNAVYGLTVAGSASTTVSGNQFEMDGNPLEGLLTLAASKAAEVAQAKAAQAMAAVQGAVQGAVDQVMGPINSLTQQASALGGPMGALSNGNLGASAGLTAGALSLPSAGSLVGSLAAGPAAFNPAVEGGTSAASISLSSMMNSAVEKAAGTGLAAAKQALGAAQGEDASGAGGASAANVAGPVGDVGGLTAEDMATGPGHAQYKITGDLKEEIGALRLTAAASSLMTNVTATMDQKAGAAHIELVLGSRAESIEGAKSETSAGLVVITKSDETETVNGMRSAMVGGAVLETIKGDHVVESSAMVSLVGAMHKVEAKGKITFKCGGSSVVVDGGGITVQSPAVDFSASSIKLTKNVNDG